MISESQCIKHCLGGQPTKYDKQIHVPLLVKSFYYGKSVREFCAEALISIKTFYSWLKRHEEFKDTYDIAINVAAVFWERIPFETPDFNYPYLQAVMRNRFNFGKSTFKFGDIDKPIEIYEAAQKALDNNEITVTEAKQMGDFAQGKLNVINNSLEKGEAGQSSMSPEEQYERVKAYNRMLDSMEGIQKAKEELCK